MSRDQDFSAGFIFASELRQTENFQVKYIKRTRWPFYPTLLCRLTFKFTQYLSSMSYVLKIQICCVMPYFVFKDVPLSDRPSGE